MSNSNNFWKTCAVFFTVICVVQSARILGVFHMPAYSHFQLGDVIFRELAARGHEVTVITPFELKTPVKNLKHVVLTGFVEQIKDMQSQMFNMPDVPIPLKFFGFEAIAHQFTEATLNNTNVQKLLKSNEKFDLVIYELFLNDAFAGFANHYKAPNIILCTTGASQWTNPKMGNPHNPSYMPDYNLPCTTDMNFNQRVINTFIYITTEIFTHLYALPRQNQLLQKYFPDPPHITELYYNTSLMLLNGHESIQDPTPLVPNMINIGGYHIQPPKPLPKDLQDYLDSAKDGVIFFCMGSNLQSKDMPEEKRSEILKVLGEQKQKVLWKWEEEVLPGQPPNVKLAKWLPQQSILAHPNVKLFITHGGLLSTIEAIYFGVPVLGLPVYGDQQSNIANAQRSGYGIGIPFKDVTENSLSAALNEILHNPKYAENIKRRSKVMHDRPTKPLDTAVYWIEYVLRHNGAPHLRTAALSLSWYQVLLLDVAAAIFFGVAAVVYIFWKVVTLICGKRKKNVDKKKKQN